MALLVQTLWHAHDVKLLIAEMVWGAGVNLGRTGEARHKIFIFISSQLSDLGVSYTLPSFRSASAHGGPEGMAFARPNAILPGRSNFRRSQGFDTGHTGDAGGGVE